MCRGLPAEQRSAGNRTLSARLALQGEPSSAGIPLEAPVPLPEGLEEAVSSSSSSSGSISLLSAGGSRIGGDGTGSGGCGSGASASSVDA